MAIIRITDLSLRTIIGLYDWERTIKQDVIINAEIHFDAAKAAKTDKVEDTIDYKTINKKIIAHVEESKYFLIEKMAGAVLQIIMDEPKAQAAKVRIDKPGALRFAKSVSVELEAKRLNE
jgi:D-erythro-7,8-dihydroneopterin triphosphate epimerase